MNKILELIKKEEQRQIDQIELIPSENYVSKDVREAVGSVLMNKYSEGQPGKRYYQGNLNIDKIESLVKESALKLFNLDPEEWGVNVQAVTGSIANLAVYSALIEPGDKIMSMFLYDGGHLSHGWKLPYGSKKAISMSAKFFTPSYYYVDLQKGEFDYAEVEKRAGEEKPKIIISGGTAYPREINHERMGEIAKKAGAYYLADVAHEAGLIAAGVNKSPFEYANIVTMTTRKTLRGPIGAMIFGRKKLMEKIDSAVFPGLQGGPQNHSIAGIGVALEEAMCPEFKRYAKQIIINARTLAESLRDKGYYLVSGGTDKHLLLIDLSKSNIDATEAALVLEKANIIVNKNTVPGEKGKPWNPSGIRMGTPAVTTRGMKADEMKKIAEWIDMVLQNLKSPEKINQIAHEVKTFSQKFPVP